MLARFLSALCRRFGPVSRARTPETKATSTPAAETTPAPAALTLPVAPRVDAVPCLARDGSVHRMVYYEWGEADNPEVVVCVHGLTRTGRDFDVLAHRLARRFRVVCPDIVGRGLSDWLGPKSDYGIPQYLSDITTLLGKLRPRRLLWVGTSMGGILGMALAAQPGSLIDRLVLNDVGGEIAAAALQRIGSYVGAAHRFASLTQAEAHVRKIHAGFGPLTDAQWRHLTWHSVRQEVDGRWVLRYDPAIALAFHLTPPLQNLSLWQWYDAIRCPTLVLRGEASDLLTAETAEAMRTRGPRAELVTFPGVGHAPALMSEEQIAAIEAFLCST